MQHRHLDRYSYFYELANTSRDFYLDYLGKFIDIKPGIEVLEIGCGEGGNLLPFAEKGCSVTGIDSSKERICQAHSFFGKTSYNGVFICGDFLVKAIDLSYKEYDIILVHDVIEHIKQKDKVQFMFLAKKLLSEKGFIFWGFPAWQMPFGGHQQICRNQFVSHFPFIHLLPNALYRQILLLCKEDNSCIDELLYIKSCKVSIEDFEKLAVLSHNKIIDKVFWLINPHYKQKFGLSPKVLKIGSIKYLRNFFCTSCFYITQ